MSNDLKFLSTVTKLVLKNLEWVEHSSNHCHCHSLDHLASIDNFSILGNAINNIKESLLIFKLKASLNVAKESILLYLFDDSEYC